jgi:hypothetical protein
MNSVGENIISLTHMKHIENEQNIGQDIKKNYINHNNLLSSTTNKNMKYDSIKDIDKVINKIKMFNMGNIMYLCRGRQLNCMAVQII